MDNPSIPDVQNLISKYPSNGIVIPNWPPRELMKESEKVEQPHSINSLMKPAENLCCSLDLNDQNELSKTQQSNEMIPNGPLMQESGKCEEPLSSSSITKAADVHCSPDFNTPCELWKTQLNNGMIPNGPPRKIIKGLRRVIRRSKESELLLNSSSLTQPEKKLYESPDFQNQICTTQSNTVILSCNHQIRITEEDWTFTQLSSVVKANRQTDKLPHQVTNHNFANEKPKGICRSQETKEVETAVKSKKSQFKIINEILQGRKLRKKEVGMKRQNREMIVKQIKRFWKIKNNLENMSKSEKQKVSKSEKQKMSKSEKQNMPKSEKQNMSKSEKQMSKCEKQKMSKSEKHSQKECLQMKKSDKNEVKQQGKLPVVVIDLHFRNKEKKELISKVTLKLDLTDLLGTKEKEKQPEMKVKRKKRRSRKRAKKEIAAQFKPPNPEFHPQEQRIQICKHSPETNSSLNFHAFTECYRNNFTKSIISKLVAGQKRKAMDASSETRDQRVTKLRKMIESAKHCEESKQKKGEIFIQAIQQYCLQKLVLVCENGIRFEEQQQTMVLLNKESSN